MLLSACPWLWGVFFLCGVFFLSVSLFFLSVVSHVELVSLCPFLGSWRSPCLA